MLCRRGPRYRRAGALSVGATPGRCQVGARSMSGRPLHRPGVLPDARIARTPRVPVWKLIGGAVAALSCLCELLVSCQNIEDPAQNVEDPAQCGSQHPPRGSPAPVPACAPCSSCTAYTCEPRQADQAGPAAVQRAWAACGALEQAAIGEDRPHGPGQGLSSHHMYASVSRTRTHAWRAARPVDLGLIQYAVRGRHLFGPEMMPPTADGAGGRKWPHTASDSSDSGGARYDS